MHARLYCNRRYSALTVKSLDGASRLYRIAVRPSQNTCKRFLLLLLLPVILNKQQVIIHKKMNTRQHVMDENRQYIDVQINYKSGNVSVT